LIGIQIDEELTGRRSDALTFGNSTGASPTNNAE
jgi:hypothetical protein